jgi:hypothetical protein
LSCNLVLHFSQSFLVRSWVVYVLTWIANPRNSILILPSEVQKPGHFRKPRYKTLTKQWRGNSFLTKVKISIRSRLGMKKKSLGTQYRKWHGPKEYTRNDSHLKDLKPRPPPPHSRDIAGNLALTKC